MKPILRLLTAITIICAHWCGAQIVLINVGSAPNDGTGDPNRTAWQKANTNFSITVVTNSVSALSLSNLLSTFWGSNLFLSGQALISSTNTTNAFSAVGAVDNWFQSQLSNTNATPNASVGFVVQGALGNDTQYYAEFGANGSRYTNSGYFGSSNDFYLFATGAPTNSTNGGGLFIGTWSTNCVTRILGVGANGYLTNTVFTPSNVFHFMPLIVPVAGLSNSAGGAYALLSDATNAANGIGANDTNWGYVVGTSATNYILTMSTNGTNFALKLGTASTNESLLIGANATNQVNVASNALFASITNTLTYTNETRALTLTNLFNAFRGNTILGTNITAVTGGSFTGNGVGLTNVPNVGVIIGSGGTTGSVVTNGVGLIWFATNLALGTAPNAAAPNGSILTTTGGVFYLRTNGAWLQK